MRAIHWQDRVYAVLRLRREARHYFDAEGDTAATAAAITAEAQAIRYRAAQKDLPRELLQYDDDLDTVAAFWVWNRERDAARASR